MKTAALSLEPRWSLMDTILLSVGLIPENELTRQAGIAMDPHTKGAVVYENMETGNPRCICLRQRWCMCTIW